MHTGELVSDDLPVFPRGRSWLALKPGQTTVDVIAPDSADLFRVDLARLGLPIAQNGMRYVYHDLRHTFSTLLRGAGVSFADVGALLGHKGPGAERTAERHYVGDGVETMRAKMALVRRLPMPSAVVLSTKTIRSEKPAERVA